MNSVTNKIQDWARQVEQHSFSQWNELPDLELYMDQVKTFMNKQLSLFQRSPDDKLLTSSMVNNYVKNDLLPAPRKKKYKKEHIALLMIICTLKPMLAIPDIATMLDTLESGAEVGDLLDEFCQLQKETLAETCQKVYLAEDERELCALAFQLSIEANARRIVAEHILRELSPGEEEGFFSQK